MFAKNLSQANFLLLKDLVYHNPDENVEERWAGNKLQAKCFVNGSDEVMEKAIRGIFFFYFATGAPVVFIECNWCYRCLFVFSFIYVFVIGGDRKWCTSYIFTNSNYVAIDSGTLQSESAVNTFCYNATIDMLVETMVQNGALKQPNKKEMEKVL